MTSRLLILLSALALLFALGTGCKAPVVEEFEHFPLRGAHVDATCTDCHGESLANATPTTCAGCHQEKRLEGHGDTDPGPCLDCHSELAWLPAISDHSFFPLEFGHDGVPCLACHLDENDFSATSPVCESCHSRPQEHFAGTCESCHNTSDWNDADFDHRPFFPTPHEGVSACADCHPSANSGNYTQFTCTDCHEHRELRMAGEHSGINNYVYQSAACLECHPDGDD